MANPILDLLNNQNNNLYQAETRTRRSNPIEIVLRQNPNYRNVISYAQQNGCTYKAAFFNLCQQRGINPNQIIDALQNKM